MYKVLEKIRLSEDACLLKVQAPHISRAQAGQFVMLQLTEGSEPVPVSILETFEEGFTCFIKAVGRSTLELLEEGEGLFYVAGPLGKPFPVKNYGRVVFYTHSWGIAPAINVAKFLKKEGNSLYLCHTSEPLYLEALAKEVFDSIEVLNDLKACEADLVVSAGSNRLSKELLNLYPNTPVIAMVSVHMLDAVGLCLVCRVMVEGKYLLACSDGPWFEAHKVDWDNLIDREALYLEQEALALEEYKRKLRRRALKEDAGAV